MDVDDPEQKSNDEKVTASGILNGATDMLSVVELLSYAFVGLFRIAGFVLGELARLLP